MSHPTAKPRLTPGRRGTPVGAKMPTAASPSRMPERARESANAEPTTPLGNPGIPPAASRRLSEGASALAHRDVAATLSNAHTAHRFAPWSDAPDILKGRAQLVAKQRPLALASFARATQKEPEDWVAWQWLARAATGATHRARGDHAEGARSALRLREWAPIGREAAPPRFRYRRRR